MTGAAERLVLGTVQLGMNYGVANRTGRPDAEEARAIVAAAWEGGIRTFDTAQGYGDSESVLGTALRGLGIAGEARVITKLDPALDPSDGTEVVRSVERSLRQLGIGKLHGLMLHREALLAELEGGLGETLSGILREGLAERTGVSVYTPEAARKALDSGLMTLIQLPANILDRRFARAAVFETARERGVEIHVRSPFLQGLLLVDEGDIPDRLAFARPWVERFGSQCRRHGLGRREAALGYLKAAHPEARVVFGAETARQVRENLLDWSREIDPAFAAETDQAFAGVEERVVNPVLWPAD